MIKTNQEHKQMRRKFMKIKKDLSTLSIKGEENLMDTLFGQQDGLLT